MELMHLLKALIRRKWIIALCMAIAVIAAFFLTRNERKEYRSTAQISTGFTVSDEVRISEDRFNMPQIEVKFNNVIENFNSPKVLGLLSYSLMLHDLTEKPAFKQLESEDAQNPIVKKVSPAQAVATLNSKLQQLQQLDANDESESRLLNYIKLYRYDVESIKRSLQVARVPRTDYINITFASGNPDLSAFVVNTLVKEFEHYYNDNKKQRSDTSIANIDSLVRLRKTELDSKIAAKTAYMSAKGIVDVNMEGSNKLQQISTIESQLADEKSKRQDLTYRIRQLSALIKDAASKKPAVAASVNTSDNERYLALKAQYNTLYKEYLQKGSDDAAMKKSLDDLRRKMRQLEPSGNDLDATIVTTNYDDLIQKRLDAEAQLRATTEKVGLLQNMLNQLQGNLNGMATKGAGVEQLEREIQLTSAEYTRAKEKLNEALNLSEAGTSSFRQTLYGQPALQPEPTHRTMKIALSGVSAMVLSSLVILLLAFADHSIKTPSQFQKITGLRLLGAVSYIKMDRNVLVSMGQSKAEEKKRADIFRELLRKVRYEMEHSGKKIFLFTSTEPQQGKTTLIQALAYSLSLLKKKVLIIDTNFCNNDLTVSLSASPMLEKFDASGNAFNLENVKSFITPSSVAGVDMIGCEGGNYTPREILPQNHLLNYLQELTTIYDFIFMEGAPLNSFTDAKELVQYSEAIIGIFSSEASFSANDKESLRFFKQHEQKFLGAVLNKVQPYNLDA